MIDALEGHDEKDQSWAQLHRDLTASLIAMVHNVNCSDEADMIRPEDIFHDPETDRRDQKVIDASTPDGLAEMRSAFMG